MIFILDACSAINLLHVFKEDNNFLEDIFKNYSLTFTQKVLEEVKKNLFSNKISLELEQKQNIRNRQNILFVSNDCEDEKSQKYLKNSIGYTKLNGEFFSSALALNLSRLEKDYIFFVTDDIPAREEFLKFFQEHKIGNIISTVDFLYTLYQLEENDIFIKESFFNLKREYLIEIKSFEEEIIKLLSRYKNSKELYFLDGLLTDLKNINIKKLKDIEVPSRLPPDIKEETKKIKEYINQLFINGNKKKLFDEIDSYIKLIQEKKEYRL
jgi:hypothetical protein